MIVIFLIIIVIVLSIVLLRKNNKLKKIVEKEVDNLMQSLLSLNEPFTIEHGRNTAIKMSRNDIEKKFARRK